MSFYTSVSFFIALAVAIVPAAILGLAGRSIRRYGLVASIFFIACLFAGTPAQLAAFLVFLAVAATSAYVVFCSWTRGSKSVALYRVMLALTLAPLAVYKVSAVFDENFLGFIGISYLTFKAVQVLVEVRDGLIKELNAFDWLYFIVFFPVITSGPIDRSRRFLADAHAKLSRREYADLLSRGILLILIGAVYQLVIATILHSQISFQPFYAQKALWFNFASAAKDAWAYGLYLFFDFAGYSLMACGASYCFGIRTPRNFRAPFAAIDIKDFWNRWHITLSFWLRDFVFMRLVTALTRRKIFSTRLTRACWGYIANMGLMGCWHGLTPDYIAYGLFHGVLLAACDAYQKKSAFHKRHKNATWYKLCSWALTINLVMLGFSIFSGQFATFAGGFFA